MKRTQILLLLLALTVFSVWVGRDDPDSSSSVLNRGIVVDPETLDAKVTFVIDAQYDQIPDDSDASILTAGLLGSQYIGLQAGGSDIYLENGGEVYITQSAIVLENLIGKFLVNSGSGGDE